MRGYINNIPSTIKQPENTWVHDGIFEVVSDSVSGVSESWDASAQLIESVLHQIRFSLNVVLDYEKSQEMMFRQRILNSQREKMRDPELFMLLRSFARFEDEYADFYRKDYERAIKSIELMIDFVDGYLANLQRSPSSEACTFVMRYLGLAADSFEIEAKKLEKWWATRWQSAHLTCMQISRIVRGAMQVLGVPARNIQ